MRRQYEEGFLSFQVHSAVSVTTASDQCTETAFILLQYEMELPSSPDKLKNISQPVSRVLSRIIIHLDTESPLCLKRPTRKQCGPHHSSPIWSCSEWGLPCHLCYQKRGALLPHHFTLTMQAWRYIFCGTFRGLSPPRRYLAPCPMEPGLSSSAQGTSDYPADLDASLSLNWSSLKPLHAQSYPTMASHSST